MKQIFLGPAPPISYISGRGGSRISQTGEVDQGHSQEFGTGETKEGIWGTEAGSKGTAPVGVRRRSWRQLLISSYDGDMRTCTHVAPPPPWLRFKTCCAQTRPTPTAPTGAWSAIVVNRPNLWSICRRSRICRVSILLALSLLVTVTSHSLSSRLTLRHLNRPWLHVGMPSFKGLDQKVCLLGKRLAN